MPYPIDQSVSGAGSLLFGASHGPEFIGVAITTLGPDARTPELLVADHVIRAGWVALGWNDATEGIEWWLPMHFVNYVNSWFQFTTADIERQAEWDRIRWFFSAGTVARLIVGG